MMCIELLSFYKEGNFIIFKTIGKLRNKLFVTEDEVKEYEITNEGDTYRWNGKGNLPIEVEISDVEKKLISDILLKLDKENKLNVQYVSVYEKFVGEPN